MCFGRAEPLGLRMSEMEEKVVGDPGIEPGMSLLGGVTVRCRTLQPVAHEGHMTLCGAGDTKDRRGRQQENDLRPLKPFGMEKHDHTTGT